MTAGPWRTPRADGASPDAPPAEHREPPGPGPAMSSMLDRPDCSCPAPVFKQKPTRPCRVLDRLGMVRIRPAKWLVVPWRRGLVTGRSRTVSGLPGLLTDV
ncbi:hypothetical protein GCM10018781_78420 [Kitasatospora indigofera]|uniref:Uncharacterized protein n=1 Tax=Kitasatospora indigofera TaxID=67307 RepID=A0A918YV80_9ACTN|nr:hypothetical protein GCM10018781_78420 [Kitasatospora indigofera]